MTACQQCWFRGSLAASDTHSLQQWPVSFVSFVSSVSSLSCVSYGAGVVGPCRRPAAVLADNRLCKTEATGGPRVRSRLVTHETHCSCWLLCCRYVVNVTLQTIVSGSDCILYIEWSQRISASTNINEQCFVCVLHCKQ